MGEAQEKLIIERDDDFVRAGITLAAASPDHLQVKSRRLIEFRQDNVQTTGPRHLRCQFYVCTATGHIGGYRDFSGDAGFSDDRSFRPIMTRIEDDVLAARLGKDCAQPLGIEDGVCGD